MGSTKELVKKMRALKARGFRRLKALLGKGSAEIPGAQLVSFQFWEVHDGSQGFQAHPVVIATAVPAGTNANLAAPAGSNASLAAPAASSASLAAVAASNTSVEAVAASETSAEAVAASETSLEAVAANPENAGLQPGDRTARIWA